MGVHHLPVEYDSVFQNYPKTMFQDRSESPKLCDLIMGEIFCHLMYSGEVGFFATHLSVTRVNAPPLYSPQPSIQLRRTSSFLHHIGQSHFFVPVFSGESSSCSWSLSSGRVQCSRSQFKTVPPNSWFTYWTVFVQALTTLIQSTCISKWHFL